jgi:hypothetical protein
MCVRVRHDGADQAREGFGTWIAGAYMLGAGRKHVLGCRFVVTLDPVLLVRQCLQFVGQQKTFCSRILTRAW